MSTPRYAFLNGEIVPWEQATVHVASAAFKFGSAVFEGVRGYWNEREQQLYLFQLHEHMQRLAYSQRFMRFDEVVDPAYLAQKTIELVRANGFRAGVHVVPTVFVDGPGDPAATGPVGVSITVRPRPGPGHAEGCAAQVSAWMRVPDNAMPMRVKCNANYQNGRLALLQARADGYDTPLLLNSRGKVAEGHGMCFFLIRDGRAATPTVTSDILDSLTRRSVIGLLAEHCGVETDQRDVDRSELVAADEAFYCGTAWEVAPITSIDRLPVGAGAVGPVVRRLREVFLGVASGARPEHPEWRTPVYER